MIAKPSLLALAGALLLASPAVAQTPTAQQVDQLTAIARGALPRAQLEDGSNVPAETAAERARPIVPRPLEIQTIARGMLAGQMQHCGMDWQGASFTPYMRALRRRYRGRPMAYLGLLHGISQGLMNRALTEQGSACTDALRATLTAEAANRRIDVP